MVGCITSYREAEMNKNIIVRCDLQHLGMANGRCWFTMAFCDVLSSMIQTCDVDILHVNGRLECSAKRLMCESKLDHKPMRSAGR